LLINLHRNIRLDHPKAKMIYNQLVLLELEFFLYHILILENRLYLLVLFQYILNHHLLTMHEFHLHSMIQVLMSIFHLYMINDLMFFIVIVAQYLQVTTFGHLSHSILFSVSLVRSTSGLVKNSVATVTAHQQSQRCNFFEPKNQILWGYRE